MNSQLRKAVGFIVLVAVAYLAYTYMIAPANKHLAEQRNQVDRKIAKLNELENARLAANDLSRQLKELEEAVYFFESKLPNQSEVHKVLEQVTLIAQRHGLQPKTIRTLKQQECNGYIEQPLRMELYGDFNSYYSFLLELEKLPRITKVRELDLKKDRQNEGSATARFTVSVFFQDKDV